MNTTSSPKFSEAANSFIDKVMKATGFLSIAWILAFLLVAMLGK